MTNDSRYRSAGACIGILLLILDSKTALSGARSALDLIVHTAIPSLFPFFFLSILLTSSADACSFSLLKPLGVLFHLPAGQEYLLIPAFLGGYPAGAQAVTASWEQGTIDRESAQRLLGFCSNAGPSFLFGILSSLFPELWMPWMLWLIHVLGAVLASWLLPRPYVSKQARPAVKNQSITAVLSASIKVMANVCAWLLWLLPVPVKVALSGLLELTNGCCILPEITDIRVRFVICSAMLAAGGSCVLLQTRSVTKSLSLKWYCLGKLIQVLFSVSTAAAVICRSWAPMLLCILFLPPLLLKRKKRSSIPLPAGV